MDFVDKCEFMPDEEKNIFVRSCEEIVKFRHTLFVFFI